MSEGQDSASNSEKVTPQLRFGTFFLLYILCIPIFGWLYQSIYEKQPNSFVISKEVIIFLQEEAFVNWQVEEDSNENVISNLVQELDLLSTALSSLESDSNLDPVYLKAKKVRLYNSEFEIVIDLKDPNYLGFKINQIALKSGSLIVRAYPWGSMRHKQIILRNLSYLQQNYQDRIARLKKKVEPHSSAYRLTFSDFFYFSAVTQSTLGYGDIVPANSNVRLIVSIQLIISLLLLGMAGLQFVDSG